jgi:hypothetical protein
MASVPERRSTVAAEPSLFDVRPFVALIVDYLQRCDPVTRVPCVEVLARLSAADRGRELEPAHPAVEELRRQASCWAERHGYGQGAEGSAS